MAGRDIIAEKRKMFEKQPISRPRLNNDPTILKPVW